MFVFKFNAFFINKINITVINTMNLFIYLNISMNINIINIKIDIISI